MVFDDTPLCDTLDVDNSIGVQLRNDPTLIDLFGADSPRVYLDLAPMKAIYPLIIYTAQDAQDINVVGGYRIGDWVSYNLKAVGIHGYTELRPYNTAMDAVMLNGGNVIGESGVMFINRWVRQNPIRYPEFFDNINYYYLGGMYKALLCGI
jgi:hypothetical protein